MLMMGDTLTLFRVTLVILFLNYDISQAIIRRLQSQSMIYIGDTISGTVSRLNGRLV